MMDVSPSLQGSLPSNAMGGSAAGGMQQALVVQGQEPLTASMLASAAPNDQKHSKPRYVTRNNVFVELQLNLTLFD
jgi:hypothetical protein